MITNVPCVLSFLSIFCFTRPSLRRCVSVSLMDDGCRGQRSLTVFRWPGHRDRDSQPPKYSDQIKSSCKYWTLTGENQTPVATLMIIFRNVNSRTKKYFHMLIINNKESENLIHWMPRGTSQMDYPHIAPHQMLGQTELWQTHQTFTRVKNTFFLFSTKFNMRSSFSLSE